MTDQANSNKQQGQTKSGLIDDLKTRGLRVTPQRAIILQALEDLNGHITAEEIYEVVQNVNPYISLATVYRTLDLLKELGLITESHMGTSTTHYALRTHGTHHHAVCRVCNVSIDLSNDLFEPVTRQLEERHGFIADTNHLVIFGWCKDCEEKRIAG
ncbi:MAG: Fur family transcriptional regulator [Anaerolineae bacterium]|nr:Fur family transcriptional regulator [Anaerolineae bacterium]